VPRHAHDPTIARIAGELLADVDALADEVVALIRGQIDIYRPGGLVSQADLRSSVVHNLGYFLGYLTGSGDLDLDGPRRTGRQRAEQDAPLPEILRAYRIAIAMLWQRVLDRTREAGPSTIDALLNTGVILWEVADNYSQALTEAYRQAVSQRLIADDRRRSALVASLQNGPTRGQPTAWEVAKLLDMPFDGAFLVIAAEPPVSRLEDRLRRLDAASAWRAEPDHDIGVVSYGTRRPVEEILAAIGDSAQGRIGVSPPYTRLDQTPRATRYALVALEALPSGTVGVKALEDTPLAELMIGNLDASRQFVHRVLGAVLRLPDDDRGVYLTTAQAWLDAHGSAAEAGKTLYCHENTVRYRMRRLEEHLGGSLDDPRNLAELTAALQAIRAFPELSARLPDLTTDQ
jgi:hypothetical protein